MPIPAPSWHQAEGKEWISEESAQIIDFFREKRSLQEVMEHMGWRDKTKFRRKFIIPLLEMGLMRQTIPEKPTSPNQRYQATERGIKLLEENRR